jgi:hypothetical protein
MSISKTYIQSNASNLMEWMQENLVPTYFKSVAADESAPSGQMWINCNTTAGWSLTLNVSTISANSYAAAIKSDNSFVQTDFSGYGSSAPPEASSYAAICENGAMISLCGAAGGNACSIIITKTSNDETAVILSSSGTTESRLYTSVRSVTRSDALPAQALTFTPVSGGQTQLVSFTTESATGVVSYTPNAFYIPKGEVYGIGFGKFEMGGKAYMTNGYWAILDS